MQQGADVTALFGLRDQRPIASGRAYANLLDPGNARAFHNRGSAFRNKGDLDRAVADFDQAIKLDPANGAVTVEQAAKDAGVEITGFVRMGVGEGIEKKEEDFAAEVAKMVSA